MKPLYTQRLQIERVEIQDQLNIFYKEDNVDRDLTTTFSTNIKNPRITAQLIAEENLIIAGLPLLDVMFNKHDIRKKKEEGSCCNKGDVLCNIIAPASLLLSHERILLNLIQRMSGIASLTSHYVQILNSSNIKILDTRKTSPGLRLFEKYSVCIGGGYNHRFDLYDGIMFKDNHLVIIDNLNLILKQIKKQHPKKPIQIEVDTLSQLKLILHKISITIDAILLDNMDINTTKRCAELIRQKLPKCFIEVSGGINFNNILNYQKIDIDGISIGALTHQATSKNIKLEFKDYEHNSN